MGKKHKKQARKQRLAESRARPPPRPKGKPAPKGKQKPLRNQPIVFVRGDDDYEPVKYAMGDGHEKDAQASKNPQENPHKSAGSEAVRDPVDTQPRDDDSEQGPDFEIVDIDITTGSPVDADITTGSPVDVDITVSLPTESPTGSPTGSVASPLRSLGSCPSSPHLEISDFEPDLDGKLDAESIDFGSDSESSIEIRANEPLPSDFEDSDSSEFYFSEDEPDFQALDYEPVEGTSYFGDYAVLSDGDNDDNDDDPLSMGQDIDYNDMDLDDLVKLGIGMDEEYMDDLEYDMDSDADDVIAGLLAGDSLNSLGRPVQRQPKRQKKELSKRRRARIEAREAARAVNFGKCPPLWQKYPEQMTVHEVLEELQVLVYTPNIQELRFPPLDHNANWYVGELSKLHGLKIKSYTAAKSNCILVLKTSRAMVPDGPQRAKMGQLMHRRQTFRRVDISREPRNPKEPKTKIKGARPKEGDIVGQNAEAVAEGFGHRLMQQMGWSVGTGLGTQRDGIQLPLLARVKLTKGGLRE